MSVIEAMARAAAVGSGWIHEYEWGGPDGIFDTEDWRDAIRAALAEARKHGWQLVPVEPAETMLRRSTTPNEYCPACGYDALWAGTDGAEAKSLPASPWPKEQAEARENIAKIYRAMLAAAPSVEDA